MPLRNNDGKESVAYTDGTGNVVSETEYLIAIENAFERLIAETIFFGGQNAAEWEDLSRGEIIKKPEESYDKYMK